MNFDTEDAVKDEEFYALEQKCSILSIALFRIGCVYIDNKLEDEGNSVVKLQQALDSIYSVVLQSKACLEIKDGAVKH